MALRATLIGATEAGRAKRNNCLSFSANPEISAPLYY